MDRIRCKYQNDGTHVPENIAVPDRYFAFENGYSVITTSFYKAFFAQLTWGRLFEARSV